jgi:hypothetical protein
MPDTDPPEEEGEKYDGGDVPEGNPQVDNGEE